MRLTNKDVKKMFGNMATDALPARNLVQDPHEKGRPPNEKDAARLIQILRTELSAEITPGTELYKKLQKLDIRPVPACPVGDAFTCEGGFEIGNFLSSAFDITFNPGFVSGDYEHFGYPMSNHVLRSWPWDEKAIQKIANRLTSRANKVIERFAEEYGYSVVVDATYGDKTIMPAYMAAVFHSCQSMSKDADISRAMSALFGEVRA